MDELFSLSEEIKVGYIQTAVNISESDEVAQLTIAISMPPEADPIETSFNLLVNTMDGSATTTGLPSLNLYVPINCSDNSLSEVV